MGDENCDQSRLTNGIRWMSIGPGSGYGYASEAYLSGLRAFGVPMSWTPMGWPSNVWNAPFGPVAGADLVAAVHGDIAYADIGYDTVVVHSVPVWHDELAAEKANRLVVAFTTWETDRLHHNWVPILNRYHRVLVPSRFNAAVFRSSGVTVPITVVPHIARSAQEPTGDGRKGGDDSRFVFYLIATWTTRKAILDAVAAFLAAFTAADDVVLVIHTTPVDYVAHARDRQSDMRHSDMTWFTLAKALGGHSSVPDIVLSTRSLSLAEMDELHGRGDCFVALSRGEGWGLGAFEAAAHGNPVIVTGWSAPREFLPLDYPYFVEYDLIPTVDDEPDAWWQPRDGERWAKARIPHATALLRHVFEHREEARSWGRTSQVHIREDFNSTQITRRLLDAIGPTPAGP